MGKKIGIIAFIISIIIFVMAITVQINSMEYFEISDEIYQLAVEDQELYNQKLKEMQEEYQANLPTIFRVLDIASDVLLILDIVLIIVSFVLINKEKSKGKVFPTLSIVIIVLAFIVCFVISLSKIDMEAIMTAIETQVDSEEEENEVEVIDDSEEGYVDLETDDDEEGYYDVVTEEQVETTEDMTTSNEEIVDEVNE